MADASHHSSKSRHSGSSKSRHSGRRLLHRADQIALGGLIAFGLAATALYWAAQGGLRGRLIEIEHPPQASIDFQIDLNTAELPELIQLPQIGTAMAQRILDSRAADGPFRSHDDLARVRGIGPRTLEKLRPYLAPIEAVGGEALAQSPPVARSKKTRRRSAGQAVASAPDSAPPNALATSATDSGSPATQLSTAAHP